MRRDMRFVVRELAELGGRACAETYRAGDAIAAAQAIVRMLDRIDAGRDDLRASAQLAVARLPTMEEQFARTYAAYQQLLVERRAGR